MTVADPMVYRALAFLVRNTPIHVSGWMQMDSEPPYIAEERARDALVAELELRAKELPELGVVPQDLTDWRPEP